MHIRLCCAFYHSPPASGAGVIRHLVTGRPAQAPAGQYASIAFTQRSKNWVFRPQGRHIAPTNVKFGTGERPVLNFKFGNTAPKTVKI